MINKFNTTNRVAFALSIFAAALLGSYRADAAILASDGSRPDVQAKLDAAKDGDVITLPAGVFRWDRGISVRGKGVHLMGAGSGRILARSGSSVSIGNGLRTFITQAGLDLVAGQTVLAERTGNTGNFVHGVVASYSGNTLTLDVQRTGGSGTHNLWILSSGPKTTVVHDAGTTSLISLNEDDSHNVELSGIQFLWGSGSGNCVELYGGGGNRPILVHDNWFRFHSGSSNGIYFFVNRGVVWNCSFDSSPFSLAPLGIHVKIGTDVESWTTASSMGSADTTGFRNIYIEDCDFHAFLNATDFDDNGRVVFRNNLLNNAGVGTHGADTSNFGVRHYEVYDNEFVFDDRSPGGTFNLNWWFYLRGGTGVITDNILPNITSQDYNDRSEIVITIQNLQRESGPNPLWGRGILGAQYPCPRQVGLGYSSGAAGRDSITYVGDSEPLHIWNNRGIYSIGVRDYGTTLSDVDSALDYVREGRDFIMGPKAGWSKPAGSHPAAYPHSQRRSPRFVQIAVAAGE